MNNLDENKDNKLENNNIECEICLENFPQDCFQYFPCCHKLCHFCYNSLKKWECPYCRYSLEPEDSEHYEEDDPSYTENLPVIINHRRNRRNRRNRQARNSNNSDNSDNSSANSLSSSPINSNDFNIRTITERFSTLLNDDSNNINFLITNYRRNRITRNSNRNSNTNTNTNTNTNNNYIFQLE